MANQEAKTSMRCARICSVFIFLAMLAVSDAKAAVRDTQKAESSMGGSSIVLADWNQLWLKAQREVEEKRRLREKQAEQKEKNARRKKEQREKESAERRKKAAASPLGQRYARENSAHYSSCADARRHTRTPIRRGQPGYSGRLDRDNDGLACE